MDFIVHNAYWIALLPALAFPICLIKKWGERVSGLIGIVLIGLAWLWSVAIFATTLHATPYRVDVPWIPAPNFPVMVGFQVDHLTTMMLLVVTTVSLLVHIYSTGYMHGDPRFNQFYAYLGLFSAAMLGLVLADNWLLLMICWELVGLSSYLLIGFWYEKPSAMRAAKKAFVVTRLGDLGLLIGVLIIWNTFHTFQYDAVRAMLDPTNAALIAACGAAAMLMFMGAVGKSAQFPLHVWLPDAMEGPTPVSALIHAATMVAAGVYLVGRSFFLFEYGSLHAYHWPVVSWFLGGQGVTPLGFVRLLGVLTLFIAATIAVAQNDIKRVLAYSTISQLGYMVMGIGTGLWVAGLFHLLTHAAFKALLFLGSGSVIHGTGTQDMREMGGLKDKMPRTYWTYMIGYLALAGFPLFFAGFWSKDAILDGAFILKEHGAWLYLALGTAGAFLTAFYMTRQMSMVFFGRTRNPALHIHESSPAMTWPLMLLAVPAVALGWIGIPQHNLIHEYLTQTPAPVVVSAAAMASRPGVPNAALSTVPAPTEATTEAAPAEGEGLSELPRYLQGATLTDPALIAAHEPERESGFAFGLNPAVAIPSSLIGLLGILFGWLIYRRAVATSESRAAAYATQMGLTAAHADPHGKGHGHGAVPTVDAAGFWHEPLAVLGPIWRFLEGKWFFDELYWAIIVTPYFWVAAASAWIDRNIIDGLVNLVGWLGVQVAKLGKAIDTYIVDGLVNAFGSVTDWAGRALRPIQTGRVQNYVVVVYLGALILVTLSLYFIPHAPATRPVPTASATAAAVPVAGTR